MSVSCFLYGLSALAAETDFALFPLSFVDDFKTHPRRGGAGLAIQGNIRAMNGAFFADNPAFRVLPIRTRMPTY
jgi:hypothetical protein